MGKITDEKERGKYYGGETKKEGKIAGVKESGKERDYSGGNIFPWKTSLWEHFTRTFSENKMQPPL